MEHLLKLGGLSRQEILHILDVADEYKRLHKLGTDPKDLQGKADEAFTKIASLEEERTRKDQGWKTEVDSAKRLADLQAQNAATHCPTDGLPMLP